MTSSAWMVSCQFWQDVDNETTKVNCLLNWLASSRVDWMSLPLNFIPWFFHWRLTVDTLDEFEKFPETSFPDGVWDLFGEVADWGEGGVGITNNIFVYDNSAGISGKISFILPWGKHIFKDFFNYTPEAFLSCKMLGGVTRFPKAFSVRWTLSSLPTGLKGYVIEQAMLISKSSEPREVLVVPSAVWKDGETR